MQHHSQRGGTFLGFIIGLVLGLGVALAVAVYVTKVPTPFSNKNQPRTNEQDVQETEKNKDWNPNSVFQHKPPADAPAAPNPAAPTPTTAPAATPAAPEAAPQKNTTGDAGRTSTEAAKSEPRPAVTADPLGDLAKAKAGLSTPAPAGQAADPFDYVIQVGAYRTPNDADAQKAKLALMGLDAKVSEREQAGRTVYRVRLGPFADKTTAERIRTRLEGTGIDNTLVRVQR